jgi:hypothetical protein
MAVSRSMISKHFNEYKLTLTSQRATTVRVRVQNSDLRGLDASAMTNSVGMLGRAALVASCLAADVGKYIPSGW